MYVIIYASVKYTANGTLNWVKMVKNLAVSYTTFRTRQNENIAYIVIIQKRIGEYLEFLSRLGEYLK